MSKHSLSRGQLKCFEINIVQQNTVQCYTFLWVYVLSLFLPWLRITKWDYIRTKKQGCSTEPSCGLRLLFTKSSSHEFNKKGRSEQVKKPFITLHNQRTMGMWSWTMGLYVQVILWPYLYRVWRIYKYKMKFQWLFLTNVLNWCQRFGREKSGNVTLFGIRLLLSDCHWRDICCWWL